MIEYIEIAFAVASGLVLIASTIGKVIEMVTDVHPSESLDANARKIRRYTAKAQRVLDKLAMNPKR